MDSGNEYQVPKVNSSKLIQNYVRKIEETRFNPVNAIANLLTENDPKAIETKNQVSKQVPASR
ncbi:hypothetical protein HK096_008270, partial [Nowakowskiella sp. JEL0078]